MLLRESASFFCNRFTVNVPGSNENRIAPCLTWLSSTLGLLTAAVLLYASYAALTWGKFQLYDYGIYTNMIWNSGHGQLFRVMMDRTYLTTHLSFTLALLGPLYRLWDHPFLLSLLQWLMLMAGALIVWSIARKERLRADVTAALLFFYVAYPYAQSVQLSEFHGVCFYLFLVPWLYYCMAYRKSMVWIPLMLLLGLREDAFLIALPMLLYFAIRDRWKMGYLYFLLAIAYGLIAMFYLFPLINEMGLFDRRQGAFAGSMGWGSIKKRAAALLWVVLPMLMFLRRGWLPVILFPLVAILIAMGSGYWRQYELRIHYPAAIMACLAVGMLEAIIRTRRKGDKPTLDSLTTSTYLCLVTIVAHVFIGFIFGGGQNVRTYLRVHPDGVSTLDAASRIPKGGILLCEKRLAGFCANREDLLAWKHYEARMDVRPVDYVFLTMQRFLGRKGSVYHAMLEEEEFGVRYFDGHNLIFERGYDTRRNAEALQARKDARNTIRITNTSGHAGEDKPVPGCVSARYWEGDGSRAPVTLSYGRTRTLNAGRWKARIRLRSAKPKRAVKDTWGSLSLHVHGEQEPMARMEIEPVDGRRGMFRIQDLTFELWETTDVEPRVMGGDARLWLDYVGFVPAH